MSLEELKERIKNEVVLREGDLFEWQWQQLGLVAEAEQLGVSANDFLGLVNEESRSVNPYFGRISDLKIKVIDWAQQQQRKLTQAQITQIVEEAGRLQLQPAFVQERWIPAILNQLPAQPERPASPAEELVPVKTTPIPSPVTMGRATPSAADERAVIDRKVNQFLDEYKTDNVLPARVLKPLFLATTFDETVLAETVLAYLSANFYAAETPPQGATVKDKLLSTDWRHLSWWADRQASADPEPVVSAGVASAPEAYEKLLAQEPVVVAPAPRPVSETAPPRQGLSDSAVIGLAIAGALLILYIVFGALSKKSATPDENKKVEKTSELREPDNSEKQVLKSKQKLRKKTSARKRPSVVNEATSVDGRVEGDTKPNTTLATPYDEIQAEAGQYGEHRAVKNGRWGLWRNGEWLIRPRFDDIALFRQDRAIVILNGQRFAINRQGDPVRD